MIILIYMIYDKQIKDYYLFIDEQLIEEKLLKFIKILNQNVQI